MPPPTRESLERAADRPRLEIEAALRGSSGSILIIGPSERAKLLLLESIWLRPPKGFAAIPVPCHDATADRIAARILEITRAEPVGNAEAALARMMRTQSIRGARPLLLLDDLDALSLLALSRLRSIADGCRVEVRWLAAGSGSRASDHVVGMLPQPVCVVALDASLSLRTESAMAPPEAAAEPRRATASSEPATIPREIRDPSPAPAPPRAPPPPSRAPEPIPVSRESSYKPIRARTMAPRRPEPPRREVPSAAPASSSPRRVPSEPRRQLEPRRPSEPRKPSEPRRAPSEPHSPREPRRPSGPHLSRHIRGAIVGAIIAGAALFLWVDRGPQLWERVTEVADVSRVADRVVPGLRRAAATLTSFAAGSWQTITDAVETARSVARIQAREEVPTPDVAAVPPEPPPPRAAPAAAPIQVGINSDPWSNVSVDDVDYGSTPLSIALSPGPHRFRAKMADGRVVEKKIEVAEDQDQIVFR